MKNKLMVLAGLVLMSPLAAFAQPINPATGTCAGLTQSGQGVSNTGGIKQVICQIGDILSTLIPILMVIAILYFIWGVINYVIASDEEAKQAGRDRIIYGVIGLAVIVGVWGLVKILQNTFGFDNQDTSTIILPGIDINN